METETIFIKLPFKQQKVSLRFFDLKPETEIVIQIGWQAIGSEDEDIWASIVPVNGKEETHE